MTRPNLLLCFDAFGTLFKPSRPVALQYADVARQCGLTNFSDEELRSSFAAAFRHQAKANPNYGRANGLGATQWWTNVITGTFDPFLRDGQTLPRALAPRLLHRFSSEEAYAVEDGLVSSIRLLHAARDSKHFSRILIGVITNSDDRVPDVLSSFGIRVSPLRYGLQSGWIPDQQHDIDFHCMSYDVGYEKPDRRIFRAADSMLARILESQPHLSEATKEQGRKHDQLTDTWLKVYVGDEYEKDVVGSTNAGWKAVLLDSDNSSPQIPQLEDHLDLSLESITNRDPVLRVQSIRNFLKWLASSD